MPTSPATEPGGTGPADAAQFLERLEQARFHVRRRGYEPSEVDQVMRSLHDAVGNLTNADAHGADELDDAWSTFWDEDGDGDSARPLSAGLLVILDDARFHIRRRGYDTGEVDALLGDLRGLAASIEEVDGADTDDHGDVDVEDHGQDDSDHQAPEPGNRPGVRDDLRMVDAADPAPALPSLPVVDTGDLGLTETVDALVRSASQESRPAALPRRQPGVAASVAGSGAARPSDDVIARVREGDAALESSLARAQRSVAVTRIEAAVRDLAVEGSQESIVEALTTRLVDEVSVVIEHAELQASSIREEASAKAKGSEAAALAEAQRIRGQADDYALRMRDAAEQWVLNRRQAVEGECEKVLAGARSEAKLIVNDAQAEADVHFQRVDRRVRNHVTELVAKAREDLDGIRLEQHRALGMLRDARESMGRVLQGHDTAPSVELPAPETLLLAADCDGSGSGPDQEPDAVGGARTRGGGRPVEPEQPSLKLTALMTPESPPSADPHPPAASDASRRPPAVPGHPGLTWNR